MARASTSGFMTMPGPPPAGVSSTVRCLSVAKARMSMASSDHTPAARALPARLALKGPGKISGNSVRTLARHISSSPLAGERGPAARGDIGVVFGYRSFRGWRPPTVRHCLIILSRGGRGWRRCFTDGDDDPSPCQVDHWHRQLVERQHFGRAAFCPTDLDQIAGAEIVDADDRAKLFPDRVEHRKPDQIGVV